MDIDSAFSIGSSHIVCQDYAIADNDSKSIIVCDGCSSSENTDIGSRLLALCTKTCLEEYQIFSKDIIIEKIKMYSRLLKLTYSTFDSTLMVVKKNNDILNINIIGDGILVFEKEKTLVINDFVCENNYPPYLSYNLNEERKKNLINTDEIKHKRTIIEKENHLNIWGLENDFLNIESFYIAMDNDFKSVTLFSDGIHSFGKRDEMGIFKPLNFIDIIFELMDFKSTTGKFIQRRLNRFEKDCKKRGWEHYDDLSMATIYLKEDEI
ncbi:MAG: protein phosphatase 2C domain-containing protein [Candidatus Nanoarchaeia archaeon]|nr:protein phosphatase 2C domain-containing protein [Candidatus Nanoarchaeia archaeon]